MGTSSHLAHLVAVRELPADLVAGYLLVVMPAFGRARYRRLSDSIDPTARMSEYVAGMVRKWRLALVCVLLLAIAGVAPRTAGLTGVGHRLGPLTGQLMPVVVTGALITVLMRRRPQLTGRLLAPVAGLLPTTARERRAFAGVAITAGITEEVIYRGFVLHLLLHAGFSQPVSLAVMALAFGAAHVYQGAVGVAGTAMAGYLLGELALASGSLLLPIVLHALLDLRVLLLIPPGPVEPIPAAIAAGGEGLANGDWRTGTDRD